MKEVYVNYFDMRRILTIATGCAVNSLLPIIAWICWGLLIDKDLIAVFSLTYPIQYIGMFITDLIGYGVFTNVMQEKDK